MRKIDIYTLCMLLGHTGTHHHFSDYMELFYLPGIPAKVIRLGRILVNNNYRKRLCWTFWYRARFKAKRFLIYIDDIDIIDLTMGMLLLLLVQSNVNLSMGSQIISGNYIADIVLLVWRSNAELLLSTGVSMLPVGNWVVVLYMPPIVPVLLYGPEAMTQLRCGNLGSNWDKNSI